MTDNTLEPKELLDQVLTKIAQKYVFGLETLETQNSDSADFYDVAVWQIKDALIDAFVAGMHTGMTI